MRLARALASFATLVGAALIPKCPLCVAAALSVLGLGAVAPFARAVATLDMEGLFP
jgi:hypothetical protein